MYSLCPATRFWRSRKVFAPVEPYQNLKPDDLLAYSQYKQGRYPVEEVSGVYSPLFLDTDYLKMALGARKVSRTLEKRAPG